MFVKVFLAAISIHMEHSVTSLASDSGAFLNVSSSVKEATRLFSVLHELGMIGGWCYTRVFEADQTPPEICLSEMRQIITTALRTIFGEDGAATRVDILKYLPESRKSILRIPQRDYVKVRNALCLYGKYGDRRCAFRVKQASAHLMSLAGETRHR